MPHAPCPMTMTANFSRRQFLLYGSATFGTSLLLKACSSRHSTSTPGTGGGFKVAIALPGVITDQAWNQLSGSEPVEGTKCA